MRILTTSDLRYSGENKSLVEHLAAQIRDEAPDVLLIAGNLGESLAQFEAVLCMFEGLPCPKAVIAGDRDVWNRDGQYTSQQLWADILPAAIRRHGYAYLEEENLIVGHVGICGTIGWYDYSGRDTRLGYTVEQYRELKGLVNRDAQYIDWPWSDQEFAGKVQNAFASRLEALERDRAIAHVVVVTHIPIFQDAIVHIPNDAQWNFGTAYAFNLTLGRMVAPRMKVRHVVSGHSRIRGDWEISFGHNVLRVHSIGRRGKQNPAYVVVDV